MWKFVEPLGIITYCFLLLTVLTGVFKVKMKYHKILAIIALLLATIHAGIVIISN